MERDYSQERNWYILQTSPGFENTAKVNLERRIKTMNMEDKIFQVLIPEETYYVENAKGEKKEKLRRTYPGYVFIEMIVDHESWFIVRNTPAVTGFLGSSGKGALPVPLSPEEMNPILARCGLSNEPEEEEFLLEVGDDIRITNGAFKGSVSKIEAIDEKNKIIKCYVDFLGRKTLSDINFSDVEAK